jgi:hypothetical protein
MKLLVIPFFAIMISCTSNKFCSDNKKYLKSNIDTTKEYKLKGVYCVSSIKDTTLDQGNCMVKVNVYDRITGKNIENGVIYLYGSDTTSIIFNSEIYQKKIKAGDYFIEAWASRFIGTKTKKLSLKENKKIEINFYLGTTVEF